MGSENQCGHSAQNAARRGAVAGHGRHTYAESALPADNSRPCPFSITAGFTCHGCVCHDLLCNAMVQTPLADRAITDGKRHQADAALAGRFQCNADLKAMGPSGHLPEGRGPELHTQLCPHSRSALGLGPIRHRGLLRLPACPQWQGAHTDGCVAEGVGQLARQARGDVFPLHFNIGTTRAKARHAVVVVGGAAVHVHEAQGLAKAQVVNPKPIGDGNGCKGCIRVSGSPSPCGSPLEMPRCAQTIHTPPTLHGQTGACEIADWRYQPAMQAAAAEVDALKKHQERVRLLEVCQAELRALKPTRVR